MGGGQKKIAEGGGDSLEVLLRERRRRYERRRGRVPTRRELIEDAALAEYEAEGGLAATREENVLVAIYDLLGALALTQGVDLSILAARLQDWDALRPRRRNFGTEPARREREDAETRRAFSALLAHARAASRCGAGGNEKNA